MPEIKVDIPADKRDDAARSENGLPREVSFKALHIIRFARRDSMTEMPRPIMERIIAGYTEVIAVSLSVISEFASEKILLIKLASPRKDANERFVINAIIIIPRATDVIISAM